MLLIVSSTSCLFDGVPAGTESPRVYLEELVRAFLELHQAVAEAADSELRRVKAGAPWQDWPPVPPPQTTPPPTTPARAAPAGCAPQGDLAWVARHYYQAKVIPCETQSCVGRAVRLGRALANYARRDYSHRCFVNLAVVL